MGFITIKAYHLGEYLGGTFSTHLMVQIQRMGPFLWIIHMFILSEAGLEIPCLVEFSIRSHNRDFSIFFNIRTPIKVSIVEVGVLGSVRYIVPHTLQHCTCQIVSSLKLFHTFHLLDILKIIQLVQVIYIFT